MSGAGRPADSRAAIAGTWSAPSRGEEHGPGHPSHRHLDEHGSVHLEGLADEAAHLRRLLRTHSVYTEGLRELHQVGVLQRRPVLAAPILVEIAGDVAEGLIVEDDADHVDAVLSG